MDQSTSGTGPGSERKAATSARIYDYLLGGVHNFPADRMAAQQMMAQFPMVRDSARSNRAFLRRAVRHVTGAGVRQFLDLGSGIPTEGNVHEIAQQIAPDSRVVYVDIDPVAVSESLEILNGDDRTTAVCADFRDFEDILRHERVRPLLDLDQPVAVLLVAALHFVTDDEQAYGLVGRVMDTMAPGSYLVVSHGALESQPLDQGDPEVVYDTYRQQTATAIKPRTREATQRFFAGTDLLEPGVVKAPRWRPDPAEPDPLVDHPQFSGNWAGIGRKLG